MQSHSRKDNRQFSMRKARLKKIKVVHFFFFKKKKPHNSELLRKKLCVMVSACSYGALGAEAGGC